MAKAKKPKIEVSSFGELHECLSEFRDGWIFRGHSDISWQLVPKAGRASFKGDDKTLFDQWKLRAIEYLSSRPDRDWDWLAIAQHHGLTTRLLDWTTIPLNAAYFAVREENEAGGPAVIHAAKFETLYLGSADESEDDPMTCLGVDAKQAVESIAQDAAQGLLDDIARDVVGRVEGAFALAAADFLLAASASGASEPQRACPARPGASPGRRSTARRCGRGSRRRRAGCP